MWQRLASFVLKFRFWLLVLLFALTGVMGYFARQVQLSYDFVKAIPLDDPKYQQYLEFKKQFGEDGNLLVIGVQTDRFFQLPFFKDYYQLEEQIKDVPDVQDVLSIPSAPDLVKDDTTHHLKVVPVFPVVPSSQSILDNEKKLFLSLPFYQRLLYNSQTHAYLMAVHINKQVLNSSHRTAVISKIQELAYDFGKKQHTSVYLSGLPLIRTVVTNKLSRELKIFLMISILLTATILFVFFRSVSAVWMSMVVVLIGVVWALATVVLLGYKLTILTGLIPPLIVVIGIPNCVYFLNKYHSEYTLHANKTKALVRMIQRMGIVTLFTNITAAIGFGVFYFTSSAILKEFGIVAGINILLIFVISIVFLPSVLSYLPPPKTQHTNYLDNRFLRAVLQLLENLVFRYRKLVYAGTAVLIVIAVLGILKLNTVGYIVDDIPHSDKIYTDLKFFEKNFNGVMPLEILVNTHHKNGILNLEVMNKLNKLSEIISANPAFAKPLSFVNGVKFARQAYYNGDSSSYAVPNEFDLIFLAPYLNMKTGNNDSSGTGFSRLLSSFIDSSKEIARVSVNMKDVGSKRLPQLLDSLKPRVDSLFNPKRFTVTFTGTSVIFLEGTRYIINGLTDSILLAFLLIMACMFYLFRSWRILLISLIPNIIPLAVTAGVMGWADVAIKPSTVLVFSVALGIAIDVTIRFLVNFKQELPRRNYDISSTVKHTIHDTGLSIIYTGLILFAGFMIFSFSSFGGTQALGWLTSMTLVMAMITNLTILPALLLWTEKALSKKARQNKLWNTLDDEKDIALEKLGLDKMESEEN
jgi:uncharacterized protein